jgi:hypothetical protein
MFYVMTFTEWVQVITQIVTAVIAIVMAMLAYNTYLQPPEQSSENEPEEAVNDEAEEKLKRILVFKTSKQKTWLSTSNQGLSCCIDDSREGKGGPQWTLTKTQITEILNSNSYHVNPGYKVKTGVFTIGPRRNWLYSKVLFPEPDYLHGVLKQLLTNAIN